MVSKTLNQLHGDEGRKKTQVLFISENPWLRPEKLSPAINIPNDEEVGGSDSKSGKLRVHYCCTRASCNIPQGRMDIPLLVVWLGLRPVCY